MTEYSHCPNCQAELKSTFMANVKLLSPNKTAVINEYYNNKKSDAYCTKCGRELYEKYKSQINKEKREIAKQLQDLVSYIPVITIHTPFNWDYEILDMVTGQSTTGTGVISEFTSSFTDVFGMQSDRHNRKLKAGEDMCFMQLRKQALDLGSNAIIATDIDYSEIGAAKGMLMVCMSGTAVYLKNAEVLGTEKAQKINELVALNEHFNHLNTFVLEE